MLELDVRNMLFSVLSYVRDVFWIPPYMLNLSGSVLTIVWSIKARGSITGSFRLLDYSPLQIWKALRRMWV
jgi:hypothetical protein